MRLRMPGKYFLAGLLLVSTAAVLIAIALLTNRGDITSAAVVICGMACAVTGIFILTFSGGEPVDAGVVGLLPAGDLMNICRIQSDLGIQGNAHFLPPRTTGDVRVMLFNPASAFKGEQVTADDSFPLSGPAGMVTLPSCYPLLRDQTITLPAKENRDEVTRLLHETLSGLFEFASGISADWQEHTVTVTMHRYRFSAGCRVIARESPQCCSMHPCPACSLCGALLAQSMDMVVSLDRCSPGLDPEEITAVFTLLPTSDGNP
jgi:hypothetical protein